MQFLRVLPPSFRLTLATALAGFVAVAAPVSAATKSGSGTPAASTNANPASESLLSRLPDPRQWQSNPLERAVKDADPIMQDPLFKKMLAAAQRRDARTALQALRELTDRYPNKYPELHLLRGAVALHLKFAGEAEGSFRRVTAIAPKVPYGWYDLAWVKVSQGRFPDAADAARRSVDASPSFAPGWMLLAACQQRLGKTSDAVASATRATKEAPNSLMPWIVAAQCKMGQGKPDTAIGDLEHARDMAPKNPATNQLLGSCYVQSNQPAKAVGPYELALKGAPNNPALCRQLGYCYLATGRVADAEAVCRRGVKAQPNYAPAWDMLGMCYRREGKQREAVDAFEHAVKAAPRDLNARAHLDEARLTGPAKRA